LAEREGRGEVVERGRSAGGNDAREAQVNSTFTIAQL
jgi:hypothetical protein